jgi:hypothetical protein
MTNMVYMCVNLVRTLIACHGMVQDTAVKLLKSKTRKIRLVDKLNIYLRLTLLPLVLFLHAHSEYSRL